MLNLFKRILTCVSVADYAISNVSGARPSALAMAGFAVMNEISRRFDSLQMPSYECAVINRYELRLIRHSGLDVEI